MQSFKNAILITGQPITGKTKLARQLAINIGDFVEVDGKNANAIAKLNLKPTVKVLIVDDVSSTDIIDLFFGIITNGFTIDFNTVIKPLVIFTMTTRNDYPLELSASALRRIDVYHLSSPEKVVKDDFNPFMSYSDVSIALQEDKYKTGELIKLAYTKSNEYGSKKSTLENDVQELFSMRNGCKNVIEHVIKHAKIPRGSRTLIGTALVLEVYEDGSFQFYEIDQQISYSYHTPNIV